MRVEIEIRKPLSDSDFNAMWSLNHAVFAEELSQHQCRPDGLLQDKFHHKNTYFIACRGNEFAGMISAHWQQPFSFDMKFSLESASMYQNDRLGEVRLLCVKKKYRSSTVASRLLFAIVRELEKKNITRILISGIDKQKRLYEHMGFNVVGESLKDGNAVFHPMSADRTEILGRLDKVLKRYDKLKANEETYQPV